MICFVLYEYGWIHSSQVSTKFLFVVSLNTIVCFMMNHFDYTRFVRGLCNRTEYFIHTGWWYITCTMNSHGDVYECRHLGISFMVIFSFQSSDFNINISLQLHQYKLNKHFYLWIKKGMRK